MQTLTRNRPLLLLLVSLLIAATSACRSEAKWPPGGDTKPTKPTIQPSGAQFVLEAGKSEALHASSPGATRFEWTVAGKGTLSPKSGETVLYTAPDQAGEVAVVTVVAYNDAGAASAPTSISIRISALPAVRLENVGKPSAWMTPEGRNPKGAIQMSASPNGCHTGNDCLRVHYTAGGEWAAVLWWPLQCGESGTPEAFRKARACSCAVNVLQKGHLRSIHRATFWARGEQGGEVIEFKVGADDICPTSGNSSTQTLTTEWKPYEIDLTGVDLTRAVALFTWVASDLLNPHGATFYLDDVQFEGER